MLVYWMRHGETDWNRQRRIQGCTDIPLNDEGRRQARLAARALKDVRFDAAFCSPLSRARETAQIVLQGRSLSPIIVEGFKEASFGAADGRCMDADKADPASPLYYWFKDPSRYMPGPGAEGLEDIARRITAAFKASILPLEGRAGAVFVASHGTVTRILSTLLMDRPASRFQELSLSNCAVTLIEIRGGRAFLKAYGVNFLSKDNHHQR